MSFRINILNIKSIGMGTVEFKAFKRKVRSLLMKTPTTLSFNSAADGVHMEQAQLIAELL